MLYNWLSGVVGLSLFVTIVWLIRRDHMHSRFAIWWLTVAAVIGVVGFFPRLVDFVGSHLGVSYPPTLVFMFGFALMIVKLLKLDIARSNERTQLRILVERIAILETEVERLSARPEVE